MKTVKRNDVQLLTVQQFRLCTEPWLELFSLW